MKAEFLFVKAAVLIAFLGCLASATECRCGLVGPNCSETGYVEDEELFYVPVTTFPDGACVEENTAVCRVVDREAKCICNVGFNGELCENKVEVLVWNLVGPGLLLPVVIMIVSALALRHHDKKTEGSVWKFDPKATVEGYGSKKVVLAYRIVALVFALIVEVIQYLRVITILGQKARWMYRFYTVVNFHLLIAYFVAGVALSWAAVFKPDRPRHPSPNKLERFLFVVMQVELPSTILIAAVVWVVLLPGAVAAGNPESVVNFVSFIQHGANVFLMFTDFMLNGLHFNYWHLGFVMIWGAFYVFYHNLIMLVEYVSDQPHAPSYPFLSSGSPLLGAFIVGLILVMCLFYVLTAQLNRLKKPMPLLPSELPSSNKATSLSP